MRVHASCVAIEGRAVLLRGPSGSGKSDLALRLIDGGAALVADDQVLLKAQKSESGQRILMASAPATLAGLLEIRGLGIVKHEVMASAPIWLVIDLDPITPIERMPKPETCQLEGVDLRRIALNPFEASTPAKVRVALREDGNCGY